jgi:hypothetical protein
MNSEDWRVKLTLGAGPMHRAVIVKFFVAVCAET